MGLEKRIQGFSLVELLTAIAVVGVLTAILVPTIGSVMQRGQQSAGQSLLRGIGTSFQLFATEHSGRLPGGLWPGQVAEINSGRPGRVIDALSEYMYFPQYSSPTVVEDFGPPAFWNAVEESARATTRVYVLNELIYAGGPPYRPFGPMPENPPPGVSPPPPPSGLRLEQVMELISRPGVTGEDWMMSDCDRQHPDAEGKPWSGNALPEPYHGNTRNVLYWDGRVGALSLDAFTGAGSPPPSGPSGGGGPGGGGPGPGGGPGGPGGGGPGPGGPGPGGPHGGGGPGGPR